MTHSSTSAVTSGAGAKPTQTNLKVLTGVSAVACASHMDADGRLHGHTWQITAWWLGQPDATAKQAELRNVLSTFDHAVLNEGVNTGEAIACEVLDSLNCERVQVARPLEGIFAEVWK